MISTGSLANPQTEEPNAFKLHRQGHANVPVRAQRDSTLYDGCARNPVL